ncbi:MAG: hypothetical protein D3924_15685 [Candidatus Electrothrix sp. AR4]|nr:hypothetical protein [Candidatus Electrothrix sp. AR4]
MKRCAINRALQLLFMRISEVELGSSRRRIGVEQEADQRRSLLLKIISRRKKLLLAPKVCLDTNQLSD